MTDNFIQGPIAYYRDRLVAGNGDRLIVEGIDWVSFGDPDEIEKFVDNLVKDQVPPPETGWTCLCCHDTPPSKFAAFLNGWIPPIALILLGGSASYVILAAAKLRGWL